MRRQVISFWESLLPVILCRQQNLEYLRFIGIGQTHLWAQKMKWWHWLKRISWKGQMCLVQPLILYNVYLHLYDFIVLTLNMHIQKIHHLRASPIFIAAGREKHLHKFDLARYPWTITTCTTYFTGIPPHVILMLDIKSLKATFEQHTRDIVQEMRS